MLINGGQPVYAENIGSSFSWNSWNILHSPPALVMQCRPIMWSIDIMQLCQLRHVSQAELITPTLLHEKQVLLLTTALPVLIKCLYNISSIINSL